MKNFRYTLGIESAEISAKLRALADEVDSENIQLQRVNTGTHSITHEWEEESFGVIFHRRKPV